TRWWRAPDGTTRGFTATRPGRWPIGPRLRPRRRWLTRWTRRHKGRRAQLRLALAVLARLNTSGATVAELSEALAVHRRTIWRVLAAMRAVGLPILAGRDP